MNNKQELNSAGASRNYIEIQKEGRTIPLLDILSRGRIMVLVSRIRKEFLMKIARKTFNHLVTQCKWKNLLKKDILISTMSSVDPLREVVQQLAHTFNDPQNRESNYFDFFF